MFYVKSQLYLALQHQNFSKKSFVKKKSADNKKQAKFPSGVNRMKLGKSVVHKNIQHDKG